MRNRNGVVLLVVLLVVMAITILSLGFLSRSDVELACGQNMGLRMQMDYLAESGLEHARGLILNPQDVNSEYWIGATSQQLVAGSDYYDVEVIRDDSDPTDHCNYIIDCNSYRLKDGDKNGRSSLSAQLRIDPAVCYWVGTNTTLSERMTINGDVYCDGNLWSGGFINGDVFAYGLISGTNIQGRENESFSQEPVAWPDLDDFRNSFYYDGGRYYINTTSYLAQRVSSYDHPTGSFGPSSGNPAGIRFRPSLALKGNTKIEGTIVTDDLLISGINNVITATKNFPAIVVGGDLKMYSGSLVINGLAIVKGEVLIGSEKTSLIVTGGLYVFNGISELTFDGSGNFNLAKLRYSPTWRPTAGQPGGALEFDGINDYAQTEDNDSKLQLTGDYTLSVWIKADPTQNNWAGIFSKCNSSGSTNHWTLQFDSSGTGRLIMYHPNDSWDTGITLNEVAGAWHNIAVIRNGNTMTAYLEGIPRNSGVFDDNPGSGYGHLNIGCDRTASSSYVFKGLIDGIRIYDEAHSINDIYPPRSGVSGLIGLFGFDDSGATIRITSEPMTTAIQIWPEPGIAKKWSSAGGAFYRSIERR
jgi:cytoskeletal protein CcmA (bactofilin family)